MSLVGLLMTTISFACAQEGKKMGHNHGKMEMGNTQMSFKFNNEELYNFYVQHSLIKDVWVDSDAKEAKNRALRLNDILKKVEGTNSLETSKRISGPDNLWAQRTAFSKA